MSHNFNQSNSLPMVFIHGSFANAKSWRRIIEHLDNAYTCIAVDLPGHGGQHDPNDFNDPSLLPEFNTICAKIQDHPECKNGIHLIGHSYGGVVALAAAMNSDIPVKKLTLFEPVDVRVLPVFGDPDALDAVTEFVASYINAINNNEKHACARVIDFWGGSGSYAAIPEFIQEAMEPMTKNNIRHWDICKSESPRLIDYQSITFPVQLVHGDRSNPIAKLISSSLNENIPASTLNIIQGASHFMVTSHVDECVEILKNTD